MVHIIYVTEQHAEERRAQDLYFLKLFISIIKPSLKCWYKYELSVLQSLRSFVSLPSLLWPTDDWPLTFTGEHFPPYETSPPAAAGDFLLLQMFSDVAPQPLRLSGGGRLLPSSKAPSSNREHKEKNILDKKKRRISYLNFDEVKNLIEWSWQHRNRLWTHERWKVGLTPPGRIQGAGCAGTVPGQRVRG